MLKAGIGRAKLKQAITGIPGAEYAVSSPWDNRHYVKTQLRFIILENRRTRRCIGYCRTISIILNRCMMNVLNGTMVFFGRLFTM